MFSKLRKRIFNSIFWVVVAFVILTSAVSFVAITLYSFNSQKTRTQRNLDSGIFGCKNYLETVMGFVENASAKKEIVDALQGGSGYDVTRKLDEFYNYSLSIDGVVLYGVDGYLRNSAGMAAIPSLSDLLQVADIREFFLSDESSFISVRKQAVSQCYNKTFYDAENGVVSCIHKVYGDAGEVLGLLEVDVLPQTLTNAKLVFNSFGTTSKGFLLSGGSLLFVSEPFDGYVAAHDDGLTHDNNYYEVRGQLYENSEIILFVSLANFRRQTLVILVVFFAMDVVLICVGAIVAYHVSDSVANPLEKLLGRMNSEDEVVNRTVKD